MDGVWRDNYLGRESIKRVGVEVKGGKLKNGKAAGKDEVTGEVIKGEDGRVVDWIWRLCNIAFESGIVPKDWRSSVIVPLYKDKKVGFKAGRGCADQIFTLKQIDEKAQEKKCKVYVCFIDLEKGSVPVLSYMIITYSNEMLNSKF